MQPAFASIRFWGRGRRQERQQHFRKRPPHSLWWRPARAARPSATTKAGGADDAEKAYAAGDYKRVRAFAEQGNAAGQYWLAIMYYVASGAPKDDAQAVAWFGKAADQGYAPAQDKLGFMYASG